MLRAVIFDMDGTLLDSEVVHYVVIHEILRKRLGYDQPVEEYMQYCGTPDSEMWPDILENLEKKGLWPVEKIPVTGKSVGLSAGELIFGGILSAEERIHEVSAELERLHWIEYDKYMRKNGIQAFPGVRELFAALKREGLKIGIATGSLHRIVRDNLEAMKLAEFVDAAAASEDCEYGKPAPDVYLATASMLEVEPGDCLVVEDAENGILAARAAGMQCVGFDGSQLPSDLRSAPFVFSDYRQVGPAELSAWYEKLTKH